MLGALYVVAVVVALWAAGIELGMRKTPQALAAPLRRLSLLVRVAAVDALVLPVLVWALVRALDVPDGYATGLLLVGVASAGPLGIKAAQLAGADAALAVSLVVVLELVNMAAIPLWASVLLPSGTSLEARPVVLTLVALVLLPLVVGGVARRVLPRAVDPAVRRLPQVANVAVIVAIAAVLIRDGDVVWRALGERAPLVAAAAVAAALGLGWLAGGPERATRASAALVTGVRANAVALAVAGASFQDVPEVRAGVVVFALFSMTLPLATAALLGRSPARRLSHA